MIKLKKLATTISDKIYQKFNFLRPFSDFRSRMATLKNLERFESFTELLWRLNTGQMQADSTTHTDFQAAIFLLLHTTEA